MKSLIIIFGCLLLIIAAPYVFIAIDSSITEDYEQSISGVATAAGVYSANTTICRDLYNDDSVAISTITSNVTDDSPTAAAYNSVSRVVLVTGLTANTTRTLTFDFMIDSTTLNTGAAVFIGLLRWFYVFMVIGMAGGSIYAFFD